MTRWTCAARAGELHRHRVDEERHVVGDDLDHRVAVGRPAVLGDGRGEDPDLAVPCGRWPASRYWLQRRAVQVDLGALGDVLGRDVAVVGLQQAGDHARRAARRCLVRCRRSSHGLRRSARTCCRRASFDTVSTLWPACGRRQRPRRPSAPTGSDETRAQSTRAQLPQQRVVAQRQPAAQVRRPRRAAGAGLGADHPLHHHHVPGPPRRGQLVVLEQRLGQRPDLGVATTGRAPRSRSEAGIASSSAAARPGRRAPAGTRPRGSARPAGARSRAFSSSVSPRNRSTNDAVLGAGEELQLAELHATGTRWPAPVAGGTPGSPAGSSSRARRPAGPARARSRASG